MDFTVRVWTLDPPAVIKTFTPEGGGHSSQVTCLAKSHNDQFMVSGGMDSVLIVFEAATASQCYKGNQGGVITSVSCVTMSQDEGGPACASFALISLTTATAAPNVLLPLCCSVLLYIGLVNGHIVIRTSQDVFASAVVIEHPAMAHTNVVRQLLPVPAEQGSEFLSCGDDGRVLHLRVVM